jgi:hypothetical protein
VPNTRARRLSPGLLAPLALCACTGPAEISLGGKVAPTMVHYLSPEGADGADRGATADRPWKTFKYALPQLGPGSTLILLGSPTPYDDSTTGTLNVRCGPVTAASTVPDGPQLMNGMLGVEVTVRAQPERGVLLRGNGRVPPLSIDSCQHWSFVGLHVESQDANDGIMTQDSGSVVVLDGANSFVTLQRLLLRQPNRYKHSRLIRVGDGASNVTLEENELYDFHENALEVWRTAGSVFVMRNYINARGTNDLPGLMTADPTRGDFGILLEETQDVLVGNNIIEGVSVGVAVLGRTSKTPVTAPASQINRNSLLGNVIRAPAVMGFRIDSQCGGANPCDTAHTVIATELANDVVIGGDMGISDAGSEGTHIHEVSVLGAARGISLDREPQNNAVPTSAKTTTNTLVAQFQSTAFFANTNLIAGWGFDHCDAAGGYPGGSPYAPDDAARVTSKVTLAPQLGDCLIYLPTTSPLGMAGVSAGPVGANVIDAYSVLGQLATPVTPLWDPATGFLSCGAPVPGVNDDPTTEICLNVQHRLHVGVGTDYNCPLPP